MSKLNAEQKVQVIQDYKNGMNCHEIGRKFGVWHTSINNFLKKQGIEIRRSDITNRKYQLNINYFENIDSSEKAYWLGFIFADGYVMEHKSGSRYFGLDIASRDKIHLEKLNNCLESTYPIKDYKMPNSSYKPEESRSRLLICNKKIVADLIKHGVVIRKTLILKAPDIDKKYAIDFVRGYFDGDGCVSKSFRDNSRWIYKVNFAGTLSVLQYIKDIIEKNEIATIHQIRKIRNVSDVFVLELPGNKQVYNFLKLIYRGASLWLDRKHVYFEELKNKYNSCPSKKLLG